MIYVVEVPSRVQGWIGERDGEARTLKDLAATDRRLRCGVKKKYTTHETAKGSEVWECRRVAFIEQAETAPRVPQDLLVVRNVRTGEVKYFLTNAPRTLPTPACLKVAFSRWLVERCFQDCKSELGLNHAELRTYRGLRRHRGGGPLHPHRHQLLFPAHPGAGKKPISASANWPMRCR